MYPVQLIGGAEKVIEFHVVAFPTLSPDSQISPTSSLHTGKAYSSTLGFDSLEALTHERIELAGNLGNEHDHDDDSGMNSNVLSADLTVERSSSR